MTQNDRIDRIEAILDRMATQFEQGAEERQQLSRNLEQLSRNLATLTDITIDFMSATRAMNDRLEESIRELRAGQEQHSRMLDVLIRNQQI